MHPRKVQAALRYKRVPFTTHDLMPGDVNGDWQERGFGDVKPKVRNSVFGCSICAMFIRLIRQSLTARALVKSTFSKRWDITVSHCQQSMI